MGDNRPDIAVPSTCIDRQQLLIAEVVPTLAQKSRSQGIITLTDCSRRIQDGIGTAMKMVFNPITGVIEWAIADFSYETGLWSVRPA